MELEFLGAKGLAISQSWNFAGLMEGDESPEQNGRPEPKGEEQGESSTPVSSANPLPAQPLKSETNHGYPWTASCTQTQPQTQPQTPPSSAQSPQSEQTSATLNDDSLAVIIESDSDESNNISAVVRSLAHRESIRKGKQPLKAGNDADRRTSSEIYKLGNRDGCGDGQFQFPNFVASANERQQRFDERQREEERRGKALAQVRERLGSQTRPLTLDDDDDNDNSGGKNDKRKAKEHRKRAVPSDIWAFGTEKRRKTTIDDQGKPHHQTSNHQKEKRREKRISRNDAEGTLHTGLSERNLLILEDLEAMEETMSRREDRRHGSRSRRGSKESDKRDKRKERKKEKRRHRLEKDMPDKEIANAIKYVDREPWYRPDKTMADKEIANAIKYAPTTAAPKAHDRISKIKEDAAKKTRSSSLGTDLGAARERPQNKVHNRIPRADGDTAKKSQSSSLATEEEARLFREMAVASERPQNKTQTQIVPGLLSNNLQCDPGVYHTRKDAPRVLAAGRGGGLFTAKPTHLNLPIQLKAAAPTPRAPRPLPPNIFRTQPKARDSDMSRNPNKVASVPVDKSIKAAHIPLDPIPEGSEEESEEEPEATPRQGLPAEEVLGPDHVIRRWVVFRTPKFTPQGCETKKSKEIRLVECDTVAKANFQARAKLEKIQKGVVAKTWSYSNSASNQTERGRFSGQVTFDGGEAQFFWVEEELKDLSAVVEARRAQGKAPYLIDPLAARAYQRKRFDVVAYHFWPADVEEKALIPEEVKDRPGMKSQAVVIDCTGDEEEEGNNHAANADDKEKDDDELQNTMGWSLDTMIERETQSDGSDDDSDDDDDSNDLDHGVRKRGEGKADGGKGDGSELGEVTEVVQVTDSENEEDEQHQSYISPAKFAIPRLEICGTYTTLELANLAAIKTFLRLMQPREDQPFEDHHHYNYFIRPEYFRLGRELVNSGSHTKDPVEIEYDPDPSKYKWGFLRLVVTVAESELKGPLDISDMLADELILTEPQNGTPNKHDTTTHTAPAPTNPHPAALTPSVTFTIMTPRDDIDNESIISEEA
ncbi:hypothetical protein B0T16DRAFT_458187 [Cercophora newfieldiana]|uniref:Uncharacterized protein n=1 Tax=Cercophora newfieldiana TaxID=92897 RepID=A0AA39Y858_9PEZI|nr:hypothetical protein B0T16DRAFT_458187 [Cercophora newfieldiana]